MGRFRGIPTFPRYVYRTVLVLIAMGYILYATLFIKFQTVSPTMVSSKYWLSYYVSLVNGYMDAIHKKYFFSAGIRNVKICSSVSLIQIEFSGNG